MKNRPESDAHIKTRNHRKVALTERSDFLTALNSDAELTKSQAKSVAKYLVDCRNGQTGNIHPGYKKIARECGCGLSAAKTGVAKLVETGWFLKVNRKISASEDDTNMYFPNWDMAVRVKLAKKAGGRSVDPRGLSADRGGVCLPTGNSVKLNPVKEPSEKDREDHGVAVLLSSPAEGSVEQGANDNTLDGADIGMQAATEANVLIIQPKPVEEHRQHSLLFEPWPKHALDRLRAIHPPASAKDEHFASTMYYSAKRKFEATVPFSLVEALLNHDVRTFSTAVPRLGAWFKARRWQDDDELNERLAA